MTRLYLLFALLLTGTHLPLSGQFTAPPRKLVEIVLTPDRDDWIYRTGEPAAVGVTVLRGGVPVDAEVHYETGPDMYPAVDKGSVRTNGGRAELKLGTRDEPGFTVCKVRVELDGKSYREQVKVGFSPDQIKPSVRMPDDFADFWRATMEEAGKIPLDPKITPLPEHSTDDVEVFLVSIQNYRRGQRLYGFLAKPKKPGKYPVLLSPPGAGIKTQSPTVAYAREGFVSLSIEIHGIDPMLSPSDYADVNRAFGNYIYFGLDDKEEYYYRRVYAGCSRAVDFLTTLPEFDGKNVIVTGGSQGGALSLVTAVLNPKVTAVAVFYPALCDVEGYLHGRAGGWPNLFAPSRAPKTATPEKINTMRYYDVANFARLIRVPGFYSWGYNDNTCPPESVYAAVNSIEAEKVLEITPISGHWRFTESHEKSMRWLREQLK